MKVMICKQLLIASFFFPILAAASDRLNMLNYASAGTQVDRQGKVDASVALVNVIKAANAKTAKGEPACVYIPAGIYRIVTPPPPFEGAGCVVGDGPSQTTIAIDSKFKGDLFSWSEAWLGKKRAGPMVTGIKVRGNKLATKIQNAFVFYDRNDEVLMENVDVIDLHGRALFSGITKNVPQAYMRESRFRSLRFFGDGAPGVPVVEFNSQGPKEADATNEIRMSQIDIYAARGPSFVIRNNGSATIRDFSIDAMRIEGSENGTTAADLLTIGDPKMAGGVNNISFSNLELIDPYPGFAALRLTAAPGAVAPYQITVNGMIGGGLPRGEGLRIDAGRTSVFRFSGIHTNGTNVVIGRGVTQIVLDGGGQEAHWTYRIDPSSAGALHFPVLGTIYPNSAGVLHFPVLGTENPSISRPRERNKVLSH